MDTSSFDLTMYVHSVYCLEQIVSCRCPVWRSSADDYNYPFHLERISTLNTFEVSDLGAFEKIRQSKNYTKEQYRINRWWVFLHGIRHSFEPIVTPKFQFEDSFLGSEYNFPVKI